MKVGDYVQLLNLHPRAKRRALGVVVGFNEKGEGGQHFVHVLTADGVEIFSSWNIEVVTHESVNNDYTSDRIKDKRG